MSDPDVKKAFTNFGENIHNAVIYLILSIIPLAGIVFFILHIISLVKSIRDIEWINYKFRNFDLEKCHRVGYEICEAW